MTHEYLSFQAFRKSSCR